MIEAVVALVILSAVAGIVFELLGAQFGLAARIDRKSQEVLAEALQRERLALVVEQLVPAWPEDVQGRFVGDEHTFTGLTKARIATSANEVFPFSLEIDSNEGSLNYVSSGATLRLASLTPTSTFSYLDEAGLWHPRWPPSKRPDFGKFDDSLFSDPLPLPAAVRIQAADGSALDWIAPVGWRSTLPLRDQDFTPTSN